MCQLEEVISTSQPLPIIFYSMGLCTLCDKSLRPLKSSKNSDMKWRNKLKSPLRFFNQIEEVNILVENF